MAHGCTLFCISIGLCDPHPFVSRRRRAVHMHLFPMAHARGGVAVMQQVVPSFPPVVLHDRPAHLTSPGHPWAPPPHVLPLLFAAGPQAPSVKLVAVGVVWVVSGPCHRGPWRQHRDGTVTAEFGNNAGLPLGCWMPSDLAPKEL